MCTTPSKYSKPPQYCALDSIGEAQCATQPTLQLLPTLLPFLGQPVPNLPNTVQPKQPVPNPASSATACNVNFAAAPTDSRLCPVL